MKTTIASQIKIHNPTAEVKQYCIDNLIIPNPDYSKKVRMGFWVGNTPKELYLFESDGNDLILPYGCLHEVLPLVMLNGEVETRFGHAQGVYYGECDFGLYDYQQEALDGLLRARNGILQAPAGSGKTQMGVALAVALRRKTLWLTHTLDLLNQSKTRAERYIDSSLIGTIASGKVQIGTGITFATIQTMSSLDLDLYKDKWDVVIVDECFPPGTMIATLHGFRQIRHIQTGDVVLSYNDSTGEAEWDEVEELQIRPRKKNMAVVHLSNGMTLCCTPNHPIYTSNGYVKAEDLVDGNEVLYLRKYLRHFGVEQKSTIETEEGRTEATLLNGVRPARSIIEQRVDRGAERNFETVNDKDESQICLRKNEEKQSFKTTRCARKDFLNSQSEESQTAITGWKRKRTHKATIVIAGFITQFKNRCHTGICSLHSSEKRRLSESLQDRHSNTKEERCHRDRRIFTHGTESTTGRQEEARLLDRAWVESVEIFESGSSGESSELYGDGRVYNLSVKKNHNYFADGILVHNCHRVAGTPTAMTEFSKVLNHLNARHKFGLSATVHRADGLIKATYALLGRIAYTVPQSAVAEKVMTVHICPIDTGVGNSFDYTNPDGTVNWAKLINYLTSIPERNREIRSDLLRNTDHYNLILSDRVSHLQSLYASLPKEVQDVSSVIHGKMTSKKQKEEREQAIEDMRTGKKHYLFATYSLAKEGLDIPRLDRLYLTTPQKDYAIVTQSVGRVARTFEGKSESIVYDYVDRITGLLKAYKTRCRHYRKCGCEIGE